MSKFPMVKKLGLILMAYPDGYAVLAEDLEYILQSAQVVYGYGGQWSSQPSSNDTDIALIIGITPIKKKTQAEAAMEFVERLAHKECTSWPLGSVWEEANRIIEMKDEV